MARKLSLKGERALEAANRLAEQAWSEKDPAERRARAEQALKLSPLCADAHIVLAELDGRTSPEAMAHWRRAVSVGATAVGPIGFRDMAAMADRPDYAGAYIEALSGLADALWETGARSEAITTMLRVLEVNPNDEDGIRYRLLGYFLEEGRDEEAAAILIASLHEEESIWPWAAALLGFRAHGADGQARGLLREAVAANRDVARRLLGRDRTPQALQEEVATDESIDAMLVTGALEDPWLSTPGALDWLAAELPGLLDEIAAEGASGEG